MQQVDQNTLSANKFFSNGDIYSGESVTYCRGSIQEALERIECSSHDAPNGVKVRAHRVAGALAYFAATYPDPWVLPDLIARVHDDCGCLAVYVHYPDQELVKLLSQAWEKYTGELFHCRVYCAWSGRELNYPRD